MNKWIRYIVSIFLVIAVVIPVSFSFLSYHLQLKKVKREVKWMLINNTPKDELVYFEFDMDSEQFKSLRWEHDHEFEMDFKMFDIVEADTVGRNVTYLCFPDKQETALNAQFRNQLNDRYANDNPIKNRANQINLLMLSLFIYNDEKPQKVDVILSEIAHFYKNEIYKSIKLSIDSPPPQFFS